MLVGTNNSRSSCQPLIHQEEDNPGQPEQDAGTSPSLSTVSISSQCQEWDPESRYNLQARGKSKTWALPTRDHEGNEGEESDPDSSKKPVRTLTG